MNASVSEWRAKAEDDYRSAGHIHSLGSQGGHPDLVCFLSQQCVEKLLKAALIARAITPPKTHDLVALHNLLAGAEPKWVWDVQELNELSQGAVDFRYPGESASHADAQVAYEVCTRLRAALLPLL